MRNFNWRVIYGLTSRNLHWVRVIGLQWGISVNRNKMLFSEREGYARYIRLPGGWRLSVLRVKF